MSDLHSLLERLQKADGPDREIDAAIILMIEHPGYRFPESVLNRVPHDLQEAYERLTHDGFGAGKRPPPYTAALDAAISLVEKVLPEPAPFFLTIACAKEYGCSYGMGPMFIAPTPALALLTAMVQALIQEKENET